MPQLGLLHRGLRCHTADQKFLPDSVGSRCEKGRIETGLGGGGDGREMGYQGHAQREGLSGNIGLRWEEWGLAMQGSGEELSRQKRAGVKGQGGSLCRVDTFLKPYPIPKFLSASFVLCVHQQVPKSLLRAGMGSGDKLSRGQSLFSEADLPMAHRDGLLLRHCVYWCFRGNKYQ